MTETETPPPFAVVSTEVTSIMPPGYTETQTTKADGVVTTVVTNASGGMVDTIFSDATVPPADDPVPSVNLWA
jgi:hypothetical protein